MTSRLLNALAEFLTLTGDAIYTARAYQHADGPAARRRVLDEFASGTSPSA